MGFSIPVNITNVLQLNYYTNVTSLSKFDEKSIQEIKDFMRNDFDEQVMVPTGQDVADFLGIYARAQPKYKLLGGQTRIIKCVIS